MAIDIVDRQQGLVKCVPPRHHVALIGFGTNSRSLAPYGDDRFELWSINQCYTFMPRPPDRHFELHRPEYTADMRAPEYLTWLREYTGPVYTQEVRPDIPSSVRYPIEKVMGAFHGLDYFTSTIAFMVALAIYERFASIHLYGIDLTTDEEYAHQKPCVEWWLGVAYGRGINVYTPKESALLKQPFRYGYEVAPSYGGIDPSVIYNDLHAYQKRNAAALAEWHTTNGAVQYAQHVIGLVEAAQRGSTIATPWQGATAASPLGAAPTCQLPAPPSTSGHHNAT